MKSTPYQPLILIGAARSGTKLVRDLIAKHPAVDKIPYDVNYIWRLGNEQIPHDELSPEQRTPEIQRRIFTAFNKYSRGAPILIEKTVSNCLRVPFVYAVFPKAWFIHLIRDGRDVVESVYRQWLAPPDWRYILAKAGTFPLNEAFGYAFNYAHNTVHNFLVSNKNRVGTWGPRYKGIDEDVATKELLEVCAIQWTRSVEQALHDLHFLPAERIFTIRYEAFVQNPHQHLKTIAQFTKLEPIHCFEDMNLKIVSQQNIGKGFRNLSPEQRLLVLSHIQSTLSSLGYI